MFSVEGRLCAGGRSLSRTPPVAVEEWAVRILLEYILVQISFLCSWKSWNLRRLKDTIPGQTLQGKITVRNWLDSGAWSMKDITQARKQTIIGRIDSNTKEEQGQNRRFVFNEILCLHEIKICQIMRWITLICVRSGELNRGWKVFPLSGSNHYSFHWKK